MAQPRYILRPFDANDAHLLRGWLRTPEVMRWWGDPQQQLQVLMADLHDARMRQWIANIEDQPFAYLQAFPAHEWPQSHLLHLPDGTEAVDMCIGVPDLLGRGHGSALLKQFADALIAAGASAVAIDPDLANHRARRAYQNAGFEVDSFVESGEGPVVVMVYKPKVLNV